MAHGGGQEGNKLRRVPVPDTAMAALGRYLEARGFAADPAASRGVALLGHATDQAERAHCAKRDTAGAEAGLAAATLYRQIMLLPAHTGCAIPTFRTR